MFDINAILGRGYKNVAALDIGSSYIKFLELEGDNLENLVLKHYATEQIPRNLINEDGKIENSDDLKSLIAKCVKKSGSKTKNLVISLPNSSIINKKIILPKFTLEDDLKDEVYQEATKLLTSDIYIDDVNIDYYIIGDNPKNSDEDEIMLVVSKKEKLDQRLAVLEELGFNVFIVEVEQFAFQNLLKLMKGPDFLDNTYILADCGANALKLYVFKEGELIYTKDSEIGGVAFTKDLAVNLDLQFEEAERIKIERDLSQPMFEVVEKTFLNNYSAEFLSSFSYLISATSMFELNEIILTGGMAGVPALVDTIQKSIEDFPDVLIHNQVTVARPLENIEKYRIDLTKFSKEEPGLFLVTSLALRKYIREF